MTSSRIAPRLAGLAEGGCSGENMHTFVDTFVDTFGQMVKTWQVAEDLSDFRGTRGKLDFFLLLDWRDVR